MKSKQITTIDLFAGIGGVRLGFESAGFKTIFANDFEPSCKETYDINFSSTPLTVADIRDLDPKKLPNFDLLLGGFPCQPFSIAGYRQGFNDEKDRGNLFFQIAKIIQEKKPKAFMLENVKNLFTHDKGNTFKVILETLSSLGYYVDVKIMNSMEYGNVPQNRERVYIVGFSSKAMLSNFAWPDKLLLSRTLQDVLEKDVDDKYYYKGKPLYSKIKSYITEEGKAYQWRRKYVRENKKGVSPTLTANMGEGGHNVPIIRDKNGIRKLTPRECFSLQGFPSTYLLPENLPDSKLYKQAGNSVTVTVISRLANNIAQAFVANKGFRKTKNIAISNLIKV